MDPGVPLPAFRSPSWTVKASFCEFMSAIRFGTPTCACRSEYGRSPQRPMAYALLAIPVPVLPLLAGVLAAGQMARPATPINMAMLRSDGLRLALTSSFDVLSHLDMVCSLKWITNSRTAPRLMPSCYKELTVRLIRRDKCH